MLSSVLSDKSTPLHVCYAASLAPKNTLTAHVSYIFSFPALLAHSLQSQESVRQTDNDTKTKIKQDSLITLGSNIRKVGTFASMAVSAIAAVELLQGQCPDLTEILLGFVNNQNNTNLRISTLQTIGFICEAIIRIFLLSSHFG